MGEFWTRAIHLMEEKKIRQSDLVRITRKTNATVSDWVNKGVLPRVDDAVKIADLLGVSVRYLCTGESEGELPYRTKALVEVLKTLPEEDIISIGEFVAILKKNAWRKKGGVPVPPDADATVVG